MMDVECMCEDACMHILPIPPSLLLPYACPEASYIVSSRRGRNGSQMAEVAHACVTPYFGVTPTKR